MSSYHLSLQPCHSRIRPVSTIFAAAVVMKLTRPGKLSFDYEAEGETYASRPETSARPLSRVLPSANGEPHTLLYNTSHKTQMYPIIQCFVCHILCFPVITRNEEEEHHPMEREGTAVVEGASIVFQFQCSTNIVLYNTDRHRNRAAKSTSASSNVDNRGQVQSLIQESDP